MTKTMTAPMEVMRSFTFPSIDTIPFRNAFSVSVFVGVRRVFEHCVDHGSEALRGGGVLRLDPDRGGRTIERREPLVDDPAVEKEGRRRAVLKVVDGSDRELERHREGISDENDPVSQLPAIRGGEVRADDAASPVLAPGAGGAFDDLGVVEDF